MIFNTLSIAGTDPSGGAGMQADLKTFSALGSYGMSVITAVVAQNTQGVSEVHQLPGRFVAKQLEVLFNDVRVDSVKIGMLGNAEVIEAVAETLEKYRFRYIVLDPVMIATSGHRLLSKDAIHALRENLLPLVDLVTPNLAEAAQLLGEHEARNDEEMLHQLDRLEQLCPGVLIKGGHLDGIQCVDFLRIDGTTTRLEAPRVSTQNTHGTGCTLSAAIAALRPQRSDWISAVSDSKDYLTEALRQSHALHVGHGHGPVHHFHEIWPE